MGELIHSPVYNQEQVRRGLLTLAQCGGNAVEASPICGIPERTLQDWRATRYHDLYRELHDTHGREIEKALIPELRETAILAAKAAQEAVHLSRQQILNGDVKDPAGTARNLATTSAVAMDKLYLATDRPTEIRTNQSPAEILQRLVESIPGTATEVQPPALPPPLLAESRAVNAQD